MTPWKLLWTVVVVAAFSTVITSQTPSGHALFEQALAKERVEGNLAEAIKLYERVVAEFASDRALAAQALVQVGMCYEKLGRDDAVRAYERLVRDFADQEGAVEQARVRLAVLKRPAPGTAAATMPRLRGFPRVDDINEVRALSPDGTKAVFKSYDKGQNLAVYDMGSQQTTLLTNIDGTKVLVESPAWSPDGRRIAYIQCDIVLNSSCDLRVATLAGVSEVIFRGAAGNPVPAGWLPDGSALVVLLRRWAEGTSSIGLVPLAGGPFTQLRSIPDWKGNYERPSVSPDGRYIAFAEGPLGMRDVHVISRDGRTAQRITDHPAEDHEPVWSPDGRHLAFLSTRDGSTALWTVAIRDGQPAAEPVRVKDGMQDALNLLGWTTRGLAYLDRQRSEDIYTVSVDPASGEPIGRPQQIPYGRTGRNAAPVWSPDGRFLAFGSYSPAEPDRRVVVVLPTGGGEAREFPIPTNQWPISGDGPNELRWFGESRGLGFQGLDARGDRTLFRLTLATGEWNTFPLPGTQPRMEWNADGSRVFYYTQGDRAIVERDLQSDKERIVLRGDESGWSGSRGLRFSPDRRLLALSDGQALKVLDVESRQSRLVHKEAQAEVGLGVPSWSRDGRALLVERTESRGTNGQSTELRLIPIDGGQVRRIPLGPEVTRLLSSGRGTPRPTLRSVVWSPDGSRLAFVLQARQHETWVIENPLAATGAAEATVRK